ncbi:2-dehydro-3-deoxyphosphogluconate aldolase [Arthrobacter livingstonensis]|uniref:2-dehydro-3-deoxyphosphogluconate aldolase n=1 Tax=Arthrobacter livingstonensis TaxID=670078 RepID=A0A2V5L4J7_9MICC|nr:bifunctional 4-hydroxy-2-oxoglutarate aldolase/2-dehydro-3-deoxy-phosphogluconate aldolase [Arthrobacter livingstonensis]PYI65502.1 2-dehydro-3-deoxyphosphogluconate aldolase [Arthrobacter livingstonensis]
MPSPTDPILPTRPAPSDTLLRTRVIAVLRAAHASEYRPVIQALVDGGVQSIELTLSTSGVIDELPGLRTEFGSDVEIGVGTVTTSGQAHAAMDGGADYLVTPITEPGIIEAAVTRGIPIFPGGLTPTELYRGWALGSTAVKVFPAATVGPSYIAQLRGPFPGIRVVPSGGIAIKDAPAWIHAGALAVSLGGPLIGDAFAGGSLASLTQRAALVRQLVDEAGGTL